MKISNEDGSELVTHAVTVEIAAPLTSTFPHGIEVFVRSALESYAEDNGPYLEGITVYPVVPPPNAAPIAPDEPAQS